MYAALDMLLVPSKFEPCGLTQLIAMRYGTVPIVRETGGLKDTVFDYDNYKIPAHKRNGFTFKEFDPKAMNETLERAFKLYRDEPANFRSLIRKGMKSDFSWKKPSEEYLKLYRTLLSESALDVHPVRVNIVSDGDECIKSCG
jgi:starch synthase